MSSRFLPLLVLAALNFAPAQSLSADGSPVFSGERAMEFLVQQCALGPRTPGSEGNIRLRTLIQDLAVSCGLVAETLCFTSPNPMGESPVELCNLVVSAGPAGGDRLWLGAHFDTRPVSDRDPDPAKRGQPLVGANDGASGTAILMHLLELFAEQAPAIGVDLIFLDGEDSGSSGRVGEFCLGSAHLARTWEDFGNPLSEGRPIGVIILDMVGDRDLSIPMEQYSLQYSYELLDRIFTRAEALGLPAFERRQGPAVYDDHFAFIQAGLPAVDLIDFQYSAWHTTADIPEACSAASLSQVGVLLVDLLYNP